MRLRSADTLGKSLLTSLPEAVSQKDSKAITEAWNAAGKLRGAIIRYRAADEAGKNFFLVMAAQEAVVGAAWCRTYGGVRVRGAPPRHGSGRREARGQLGTHPGLRARKK